MNVALLIITSLLMISSTAMEHDYSHKNEELKPVPYNKSLMDALRAHSPLISNQLPFLISYHNQYPIISENTGRILSLYDQSLHKQWLWDEIPFIVFKPIVISDQNGARLSVFTNEKDLMIDQAFDIVKSDTIKINSLAIYAHNNQEACIAVHVSDIIYPFKTYSGAEDHNFLRLYRIKKDSNGLYNTGDYRNIPVNIIQKLAFRSEKEVLGVSNDHLVRICFNNLHANAVIIKECIFKPEDKRQVITVALNPKYPNQILFMDQKYAVYLGLLPEGLKNNNRRFKKIACLAHMVRSDMEPDIIKTYMSWQDTQISVKHILRKRASNLNTQWSNNEPHYKLLESDFRLDYA